MNKNPWISVVVPTFNRARDLQKTLASILRQDITDYEIVVSDNCSTDNTMGVANSRKDPRIRYFRTHSHVPVQANIQYAISKARGSYILLLGDDDILMSPSLLRRLYRHVIANRYGVIRLNYVSITPDKTGVFDFRASKGFSEDVKLPPRSEANSIIQFIIRMDPSFMSGIMFTRDIPSSECRIISSELNSWFPVLFEAIRKHGGYYWSEPSVLASWSVWRPAKNQIHSLYSLKNGKLSAEPYFEEVKRHLSRRGYRAFLSQQVRGVYVAMFPAVKYFTGNANLIQLAKRSVFLVPELRLSLRFWILFIAAFLLPGRLLAAVRTYMLERTLRSMRITAPDVANAFAYYRGL